MTIPKSLLFAFLGLIIINVFITMPLEIFYQCSIDNISQLNSTIHPFNAIIQHSSNKSLKLVNWIINIIILSIVLLLELYYLFIVLLYTVVCVPLFVLYINLYCYHLKIYVWIFVISLYMLIFIFHICKNSTICNNIFTFILIISLIIQVVCSLHMYYLINIFLIDFCIGKLYKISTNR